MIINSEQLIQAKGNITENNTNSFFYFSLKNRTGKEVRALFITAVRTSNLLREPHILRSLEANEDIGDLGFMSDPKLLNTALTRTQSFVAIVGDPCGLCLIGECTQVTLPF